jgi:hypothetical protein
MDGLIEDVGISEGLVGEMVSLQVTPEPPSILPKRFEPVRRQRRVAHRRGNGAMAKIMLNGSGIVAVVGELVAAGMGSNRDDKRLRVFGSPHP